MYDTIVIAAKIKDLLKIRRINTKTMLADLDMGINAISEFAKGKQMSCITLAQIADYLDCSVDYLLGRTDKPDITYKTSSGTKNVIEAMTPPTPNVEELQRVYASLNARGKEKVLDYASDLAKSPDYTTAPTHPYRIAARGGGVMDLTEEEYNKKLIEETENTKVVTSESHPWL